MRYDIFVTWAEAVHISYFECHSGFGDRVKERAKCRIVFLETKYNGTLAFKRSRILGTQREQFNWNQHVRDKYVL
jgi:hypothetical protein